MILDKLDYILIAEFKRTDRKKLERVYKKTKNPELKNLLYEFLNNYPNKKRKK